MTVTMPYGRNLVRNPKPASLTDLAAGGGGTGLALTSERSFVGGTSAVATLPTGAFLQWASGGASSLPAGSGARTFAAAVRVSGALPTSAQLAVMNTDGTETLGTPVVPDVTPDGYAFARIDVSVESDPAKTPSYLRLRLHNAGAETVVLYAGGFDAREGVADSYIDGDQGTAFAWEGTANASTSVRSSVAVPTTVPVVTGRAGAYRMTPKLYLVNRAGVIQDDITDEMIDCTVTYDTQADGPKGSVRLAMRRKGVLKPLQESFVRPWVEIEQWDGTVERGALGMFSVEPAAEAHDVRQMYEYTGYDLLWLLAQNRYFAKPYSPGLIAGTALVAGQPYRKVFIDVMTRDAGMVEGVHFVFPPDANKAPGTFGAAYGQSVLDFLSTLMVGCGWEKPFTMLDGRITSRPVVDISTVQPSRTFATGEGSLVRWPFRVEPDPTDLANVVNVRGKYLNKKVGYASATAELASAHPFSRSSIGRTILYTVENDALASNAAAGNVAQAELSKRSVLPVQVTLTTRATIVEPGSVYDLDMKNEAGDPIPMGQGRYWCTGWSMRLGPPWSMTHTLRRTVVVAEVL